jgi:hypothetical protein
MLQHWREASQTNPPKRKAAYICSQNRLYSVLYHEQIVILSLVGGLRSQVLHRWQHIDCKAAAKFY